ncbi:TIGR03085 family metal-binding protein [Corynebacterium anserum]|uniref:TIGR03085 family protein n=1 Tax=Corynebacterium anserum TaxID=2684406 RepID=A0A7G7YNR8_9CORY|nr:TIGR03085 family metal-binding protein [Corynebacterium anserum]QNH96138.1 TIGR03085 family protein [Corynebacterium anserum]
MTSEQNSHWQQPARKQLTSAQAERAALASLLLSVGPDAPTLCEGWTTRDLAVHLVVREYRPDAAAGMFIKGLRKHLGDVSRDIESSDYASIVEDYRQGPPKWNPMRYMDSFVNLAENFIHHEDVRRGGGQGVPRDLNRTLRDDLWRVVSQIARVFLRNAKVHVVLERTDAASSEPDIQHAGAHTAEEVRVRGDAGELLLWLYGRDSAAHVEITESQPGAREKIHRRIL